LYLCIAFGLQEFVCARLEAGVYTLNGVVDVLVVLLSFPIEDFAI